MKLHNLCLDRNVDIPIQRYMDDVRNNDQWVVYDNYRDDDVEYRGHTQGERRRLLTLMVG